MELLVLLPDQQRLDIWLIIRIKTERTFRFAQLESSFLIGTVVGPLIGGLLFLVSEGLPFYMFSMCGFISCIGIYLNIPNEKIIKSNKSKKSFIHRYPVWPFPIFSFNSKFMSLVAFAINRFLYY